MIDVNGTSARVDLSCAQRPSRINDTAPCILGERVRLNEVVLRWVLQSNVKYTLYLYDFYGESDRSLHSCAPFTLAYKIEPVLPPENTLSCEGMW